MKSLDLHTIIDTLQDKDVDVQRNALLLLRQGINENHGTAGSNQQEIFDKLSVFENIAKKMTGNNQKYLFDLLSFMNLFNSDENVLKYRLLGNVINVEELSLQYIRKLMYCILEVIDNNLETIDYTPLVEDIVEFLFKHNCEAEAIDFVFEVSFIPLINPTGSKNKSFEKDYTNLILNFMDEQNSKRIILYLEEMACFFAISDFLKKIYLGYPTKYLVYLIKLNELSEAITYVKGIEDKSLKKQCLFILARNCIYYESSDPDEMYILSNAFLYDNFLHVASSLDLLASKKLVAISKNLDKEKVESAAISNALVHFAYGKDPIFFPDDNDYKIQEDIVNGLKGSKSITVLSSIGLIHMFSHEKIFEFFNHTIFSNPEIGSILGLAIAAQKHHDTDSVIFDLLIPFLNSDDKKEVIASLLGISILYSCSNSSKAYEAVFPLLSSSNIEIGLFAIYTMGVVFAASGDESVISACLETFNSLSKTSQFSNFALLGIGLMFMKCPHLRNSKVYSELPRFCKLLCLGLMHVGSGNPSISDEILTESFTGDSDPLLEIIGLLSACLIGVGDPIGTELLDRITNSAMMLDSFHLKTAIPLCLALLYPSNPKPEVIEVLERSMLLRDTQVNAIIALGIVGAGTKSSRVLNALENSFSLISKDIKPVATKIIAQGLINLGKGLFTMSPLYYNKNVISNRAMVGLLSTLIFFFSQSLLTDYSFISYVMSSAFSPKYVVGFEGSCKVGKPIDTVGMVGKPNKLSAIVIHSLPIILNANERAECDEDVYTSYIEDVLVRKE